MEPNLLQNQQPRLILASGSIGRADILKGAGMNFTIQPSSIDEGAIRDVLVTENSAISPADIAEVLARAKAEQVSQEKGEAIVIGADQVLALGDEIFEKPTSMDQARDNLLRFRGRTHHLHAAICIALKGETEWSHVATASLKMRDFSAEFLGQYLAAAGDSVKTSVGAYRLESYGIHLFDKIDGDYFTILGLPLIPLLDELRKRGLIAA